MPIPPLGTVKHVVIIVQENHTTDNYMRALGPYGANVATDWPIAANPPTGDQPHDRHAYFQWLTHQITAARVQFDTLAVLPFYAYLGVTGAFLENHCAGFGTNSTPNHLLLVGGPRGGKDATRAVMPLLLRRRSWASSPGTQRPGRECDCADRTG